jgi:hypothetical protein
MKKVLGILTISAFALAGLGLGSADAQVLCQLKDNWGDDGIFSALCKKKYEFEVEVENKANISLTTTNVAISGKNFNIAGEDNLSTTVTGDAQANTNVALDVNNTFVALDTAEASCECDQLIGSIEGNDSDDGTLFVDAQEEVEEEVEVENELNDVEVHNNMADTGNNQNIAGDDNGSKMTPSQIVTGAPSANLTKSIFANSFWLTRGFFLAPPTP